MTLIAFFVAQLIAIEFHEENDRELSDLGASDSPRWKSQITNEKKKHVNETPADFSIWYGIHGISQRKCLEG